MVLNVQKYVFVYVLKQTKNKNMTNFNNHHTLLFSPLYAERKYRARVRRTGHKRRVHNIIYKIYYAITQ